MPFYARLQGFMTKEKGRKHNGDAGKRLGAGPGQ